MNDKRLEMLKNKLEGGDFSPEDIPILFEALCDLGNTSEDIQEEVEDWNCVITYDLTELGQYWMAVSDSSFSTGAGVHADTKLELTLSAEDAVQIFTGTKDPEAALNAGELVVKGDLPDAIRLAELIELMIEEMEY